MCGTIAVNTIGEDELSELVRWLRRLASRRLGDVQGNVSLHTSVLVNEAFLKLLRGQTFERHTDRAYRYAAAARAVREAFASAVRTRNAAKRGAGLRRINLLGHLADPRYTADFSDLHEAVERLAAADSRSAQVVDLKFFAGLTTKEIASLLAVSESTIEADWRKARKFVYRFLTSQ
jgi:RNA polymerase sigma factor (TIGR02999 family)